MGNRGILHDDTGNLTHRRWRHRNWIICLTAFKGRQRRIMSPGRYTELFFLDEATALAAGHRPCYECRRQDYHRYWGALRTALGQEMPANAIELDKRLHSERAVPRLFMQRTWTARISELPPGTMVIPMAEGAPSLIWNDHLWHWAPDGYLPAKLISGLVGDEPVSVLTPPTSVLALRNGFRPVVHGSAER